MPVSPRIGEYLNPVATYGEIFDQNHAHDVAAWATGFRWYTDRLPEHSDTLSFEMHSPHQITQLLQNLNAGDSDVADQLLPLLYNELRAIAGSHFARQSPGHTLQPTALVHEAYLKIMKNQDIAWEGKSHFLAVAARAMRQILINHARDKKALKRGGVAKRISIDEDFASAGRPHSSELDLLALDEALTRLNDLNERQARVVELRFFAGLTIAQTAHVLDIGTTTVEDDWVFAKAWLARELRG